MRGPGTWCFRLRLLPATIALSVVLIALLALQDEASAQDNAVSLDDLIQSAQQWANENLDQDSLRVLQTADRQQVERLLANLQQQFQGEYVIDLASLKEAARKLLPLLERYDETLPYAVWLRTRLDYLEVADELRIRIGRPKQKPGQPVIVPTPTPQLERELWIHKLSGRAWPKAAKAYVRELKPLFAAQKIPPELVWVAEVESSFDPRARSPQGAAGLFQLMTPTAKRFGLSTWPLDERLRPEPSAQAAAKYLNFLHSQFHDWRLALAAYNSGEGTVQRLLKRHKATTYDAIAPHLPAETQMFVPKVEATLLRREGVSFAQLAARG
jgi:membrane-bound lytic murein transglycosylase D